MKLEVFKKYWFSVITFLLGIILTYVYIHFIQENEVIDRKIRIGEIVTWILWIALYFGTPFFLKRFVDDEREVKKMIVEEINSAIKQSDLIASEIYKLIDNAITPDNKRIILVNFEILERYVLYVNEQIPKCYSEWKAADLENLLYRYKNVITNELMRQDFIINQQFYNTQLVDLKSFQKYLKDAKIKVMRS